ncbi:hypothetical protein ABVT39_019711 [Epinephelus coioides]
MRDLQPPHYMTTAQSVRLEGNLNFRFPKTYFALLLPSDLSSSASVASLNRVMSHTRFEHYKVYKTSNLVESKYQAREHESHKTGAFSMTRHVCGGSKKKDVSQSGITAFLNSNKIPAQVKSEVTDSCVELCCQDLQPFDIVSGDGFCAVAQSLINVGARYGRVDPSSVLPHRQTVCDRAKVTATEQKEILAKRLIKLWIVALQLQLTYRLMITTNGQTQHLPVTSSVKIGN